DMPRFQDWELWIRLSKFSVFYWIEEPLVTVYFTKDSISSEDLNLVYAYEKILDKHKEVFKTAGKKHLSNLLFSYGHNLCLLNLVDKGRQVLIQSVLTNFSVKASLALTLSMFGGGIYKL